MQLDRIRFLTGAAIAVSGALALTACIPPAPEPTPAPAPAPAQVAQTNPALPQPIAPTFDNWMDAPATPGDWRYSNAGGQPLASFGAAGRDALFALRCDRASRTVTFGRLSSATGARTMRILTESTERDFTASPQAGSSTSIVAAQVPAADPFLDAMAFSKGRFAVMVAGEPTLYVPAWPEITRVVEECRR